MTIGLGFLFERVRRPACRVGFLVFAALSAAAPAPAAEPSLSPGDLAILDTASWGVSVSSARDFASLGRKRWLAAQLRPKPDARLPPDADAALAALPGAGRPLVLVIRELDEQGRQANAIADPDAKKAAQTAYQAALNERARAAGASIVLRALYSPNQLAERAAAFWLNRFSVHAGKANLRAMVGDYMDRAIRPHALGRFRDLLGATLRHPAMLRFLDNAENAAGRLNENYAREIMELHTMGLGSGYTQADVEALARILTGIGIDLRPEDPKLKPDWQPLLVRDGLFIFNPARHDFSDKVFLGQTIPGSGFAEVERALDILARHPATARHVSRALASFFAGCAPPEPMVARMAATFAKSDGDIAAVLGTMFEGPELEAALSGRFKDPQAYVLSAVRLAYDDRVVLNTAPIQSWLNRLGEAPFGRTTPDGYPLAPAAWSGPGQMMVRFEIARQIGSGSAGLFKSAEGMDRPAFPLLQNALFFQSLAGSLSPATRAALAEAVSPQDWNTLFLSSPEFMR